jgi:hypothetical protein
MEHVETGVQTLYYGLGIIFMLGGAVTAYVKTLQSRVGKREQALTEYKLQVAFKWHSTTSRRNIWPNRSEGFLTQSATLPVALITFSISTASDEARETRKGPVWAGPSSLAS